MEEVLDSRFLDTNTSYDLVLNVKHLTPTYENNEGVPFMGYASKMNSTSKA